MRERRPLDCAQVPPIFRRRCRPRPPLSPTGPPPTWTSLRGLVEHIGVQHLAVIPEQFAIFKNGLNMFGVLDLDTGTHASAHPWASATATATLCVWLHCGISGSSARIWLSPAFMSRSWQAFQEPTGDSENCTIAKRFEKNRNCQFLLGCVF